MLSRSGAFPSMAMWETGLRITGHGIGEVFSFTLSHISGKGEVLLSPSPGGVRAGRAGQAGTALVRVGHSQC